MEKDKNDQLKPLVGFLPKVLTDVGSKSNVLCGWFRQQLIVVKITTKKHNIWLDDKCLHSKHIKVPRIPIWFLGIQNSR